VPPYMHVHCQNCYQSVKFFLTAESMKLNCILRNNSVSLSHQISFSSSTKRKLLLLFRKVTAVYFESRMERTNILREQISEFFFNVKASVTHRSTSSLTRLLPASWSWPFRLPEFRSNVTFTRSESADCCYCALKG